MSRAAFSLSRIASSCLTRALRVDQQPGHRRIDDLQAHRGVGAGRRVQREVLDPRRALGPVEEHTALASASAERLEVADALRPGQRIEVVLHAQHRRGVQVSPSNTACMSLPPLVRRKILGRGQGGV